MPRSELPESIRGWAWLVVLVLTTPGLAQSDPSPPSAASPARTRWTTSRVIGSPTPPAPYRVRPAFPRLEFRSPVEITGAPGMERLFVAEQGGRIFSFPPDAECEHADLMLDLSRERREFSALYGLVFDPDFQHNRFVYVCYVLEGVHPEGTRVSRFQVTERDPPQIDPTSERIVVTWLSGGHNGGCLKFVPDGYLYICTGDAASPSPPDPDRVGQDVSNLLSAILRVDLRTSDNWPP